MVLKPGIWTWVGGSGRFLFFFLSTKSEHESGDESSIRTGNIKPYLARYLQITLLSDTKTVKIFLRKNYESYKFSPRPQKLE